MTVKNVCDIISPILKAYYQELTILLQLKLYQFMYVICIEFQKGVINMYTVNTTFDREVKHYGKGYYIRELQLNRQQ